jgi:hypothetical protein
MDQQDRVTIIAQLRQAQRLMARGDMTIQETLEVLKLYEQGVASMLTSDQLIKYIEARMRLADEFLG